MLGAEAAKFDAMWDIPRYECIVAMHDGSVAHGKMNPGHPGPGQTLSIEQLREMAARQQQQIEMQQQQLVAKEQRLKYLKQQEYQQHQMASEYDRLRR